ncbi:MAG TPA: hypothetical protein VL463_05015 [Kofleriaceae bacterium]|jgi:hypothetical protein|nr:hypothetical protein [Kofleriaceae bacterium]
MANDTPSTKTVTTRSNDKIEKAGLIVGVATLAIDVGDKSSSSAIGFANDVRGELRVVADAGLDAIENVVRGVFRLSKRATARLDELASDLLGAGERTAAGVFKGLRDTTRAAGELASTAAGAVIGGDKQPVAQA